MSVTTAGSLIAWVVLLFGPGALIGLLLRMPRHVAVAVAPAVTFGLVGAATAAFGVLGVPWRPWTAGLLLLGALVVAAALRRWVLPRAAGPLPAAAVPGPRWAAAGIAGAAVIVTVVFLRGTGGFDAISQYWDAVWHVNYTRWIAQTGQASPLRAGDFLNLETRAPSFYPSAMHALGALVLTLSGAPAVAVLNTGLLVFAGIVVPLGAACLAWVVTGGNGIAAGFAALATSWFSALPYDQLWRPAWPYALELGLTGAVVALLISPTMRTRPGQPLVAALAVVGVASIHPSGIVTVGIPVLCWLVLRAVVGPRAGLGRHIAALAVVGVLAVLALAVQLGQVFAVSGTLLATHYPTPYTVPGALADLALFKVGFPTQPGQWALTALAVLGGLVTLGRRRGAWLMVAGLAYAALGVQTMTGDLPFLRPVTSAFWNDYWRLGAVVASVAAVLVGVALAEVVTWASRALRRPEARARLVPAVTVVVALLAFAGTSGGYIDRNVAHMTTGYRPGVVGPTDVEAMVESAKVVPAGQTILNDPLDGSAWMYAVTGVRPMFVHYQVGTLSSDQVLVLRSLNRIDTDPEVQAAVRRLGVRYVYAGHQAIYPWLRPSPGFLGLAQVAALTPVVRTASAALYRVNLPPSPAPPGARPTP